MTQPPGFRPPRRRLSWPRGHKRLTAGIAAFGLLLVIGAIGSAAGIGKTAAKVADPGHPIHHGHRKGEHEGHRKSGHGSHRQSEHGGHRKASTGATAKAGTGAAPARKRARGPPRRQARRRARRPAQAAARPATPGASQDCSDQARAWLNGGSSQQIAALEGAFGALYAAGNALVSAAGHGASRDIPAVEGAAGALQSAAGAVEANPGPSCVPGLRANLMSGAADYSEVASDAESAVGEYEAGQVSAAKADVEAARPLAAEASASIAAAEAAANFSG